MLELLACDSMPVSPLLTKFHRLVQINFSFISPCIISVAEDISHEVISQFTQLRQREGPDTPRRAGTSVRGPICNTRRFGRPSRWGLEKLIIIDTVL